MSKDSNPKLIGAFVLGALVLIVIVFVVFGSGRFFKETSRFLIYFQGDIIGLRAGSPVKVRGVDIGSVSEINALYNQEGNVIIETVIETVHDVLIDTVGVYEELSGKEFIDHLIQKGLRARLQTQSIVTGVRYIKLDFFPEHPAKLVGLSTRYPEIPSIPTATEEMESNLRKAIENVANLELKELTDQLQATLKGIDDLSRAPELKATLTSLDSSLSAAEEMFRDISGKLKQANIETMTKNLTEATENVSHTLSRMETFLARLNRIVSDEHQYLHSVFIEITKSSRAMRRLFDYLQQNPRALIFGKK
jgi:paraquat-inducible protein B